MYITISVAVIITIIIVFAVFYNQKSKEADNLRHKLSEQQKERQRHDEEVYESAQAEKKRRDLIEISLVTGETPDTCEKIYSALSEDGEYLDFFNANTKDEKLEVLHRLK